MVGAVIDQVQNDLPTRLRIGMALGVLNETGREDVAIVEIAQPELPALVQSGPFGLKQAEIAIFGIDEGGARLARNAREPDAIGRVDVGQGVEDGFIGGFEVARQFFRGELGGGVQQALAGPRCVVHVEAEGVGGNGHG